MKSLMAVCLAATATLFAAAAQAQAAKPPLIPLETLAQNSQARGAKLSPDRKSIGFIMTANNRRQVAVLDLEKNAITRLTNFTKQNASSVRWANNERLLISLDNAGNEQYGMYAVNKDGSQFRALVEPPILQALQGAYVPKQVFFEGLIPGNDREVLVSANDRSAGVIDLFRMDAYTGRRTLITNDRPPVVRRWVLDNKGVARYALAWEKAPRQFVGWYRSAEGQPWRELFRQEPGAEGIEPVSFAKDDKTMYVLSDIGRDTKALYAYDPETRKLGSLVFEAADGYDMGDDDPWGADDVNFTNQSGGMILSPDTGEIVGFRYEGAKPVVVWKDEKIAKWQAAIDAALPGRVNTIALAKEGLRMLVTSRSDRHPGSTYWFDPKTNSMEKIFEAAPWIKEEQMAEMKPIEYKARDGLRIRGYLTLPPGREAKNLPVIINPHGGPWARDNWGYNPEIQMLANRGYAVLQMDFRISRGYGRKLFTAGFKQLGLKMQDDKTDGLNWLVAQGIADPKRACIYGGSYGGYAALWGVTRDPDLYRCAINAVGVSDWEIIMRGLWYSGQETYQPEEVATWVGDIDKAEDRARFDATSPVKLAARIKAPILHGYGFNDPRVPIDHLKVMERALKANDKKTESVTYDNEGHGWANPENRLDWYRRMEKFLAEHNPAN